MLLHLAVRDRDFRFGHEALQMARHVVDILDAIVHEENLAGAVELADDHVANQAVVEMRDEGAHRLARRRRRLDYR